MGVLTWPEAGWVDDRKRRRSQREGGGEGERELNFKSYYIVETFLCKISLHSLYLQFLIQSHDISSNVRFLFYIMGSPILCHGGL